MGPYNYYNPYQQEDPYGFGSEDVNNIHQQNFFDNIGGQSPYNIPDQGQGEYDPFQQGIDPYTGISQNQYQPPPPPPTQQYQNPISSFNPRTNYDPEEQSRQVLALASKLYTPSTVASDKFNQLVDQYPQYQSPSIGRRIVAGLATLAPTAGGGRAGMAGANDILYGGYGRDLAAWKERMGPAQEAARQENAQNVNERQLTTGLAQNIFNQNRLAEQGRIADNRQTEINQKDRETADINRKKNDILYAKANGATVDLKGQFAIVTYNDGTVVNTGVPTTAFSPIDVQNLRNAGTKEVAQINQQGANQRSDTASQNAEDNRFFKWMMMMQASQNQAQNKQIPNPSQAPVAMQTHLQELYDTDSEARQWIEVTDGHYQFKGPPGGDWMGLGAVDPAKQAAWERTRDKVYGAKPTPPPAPYPGTQPGAGRSGGPGTTQQQGGPQQPPPQQPQMSKEQQDAEVAAGRRVFIVNQQGQRATWPAGKPAPKGWSIQ